MDSHALYPLSGQRPQTGRTVFRPACLRFPMRLPGKMLAGKLHILYQLHRAEIGPLPVADREVGHQHRAPALFRPDGDAVVPTPIREF